MTSQKINKIYYNNSVIGKSYKDGVVRSVEVRGFDPRSIDGLQLWLNAADSSTITVSTGVSEWRDKSTTGSVWTQTTGNNQPLTGAEKINGRNVIVFDGINDSLESFEPLSTSMPLTFFIVQQIVAKTYYGMSYTTGGGVGENIRQHVSIGTLSVPQIGYTEAAGDRTGIVDVIGLRVPVLGVANIIRRNALLLFQGNPTSKPNLTGTHYIGRRIDGFYANIRIGEIVAFSTFLSDAQFLQVESYLMQKWGAKAV